MPNHHEMHTALGKILYNRNLKKEEGRLAVKTRFGEAEYIGMIYPKETGESDIVSRNMTPVKNLSGLIVHHAWTYYPGLVEKKPVTLKGAPQLVLCGNTAIYKNLVLVSTGETLKEIIHKGC
jgi:hypothetical protein